MLNPELRLVDTHCHLGFAFDGEDVDADALVERARESGVAILVDVGIDVASSEACIARARRHDRVWSSAGLHPNSCANFVDDMSSIERIANDDACFAIGESGLDLYWDRVPLETQRESLLAHLALARRVDKTLILHCRDAFDELLETLRPLAPIDGILHCFSGDEEQARACLDLGLRISFAGPITYPKNDALRKAARSVPEDRILVETDAPFLPPQTRRGKRNEPAAVHEVASKLAEVRGVALERLADACTRNSFDQFGGDAVAFFGDSSGDSSPNVE